jgi:LacI family transcriptional regulator
MELVGEPLFGAWSESWGRQAVDVLLRESDPGTAPVTAIVCASDQLARAVGDRLRERGLRVPHDVAVTGYDNWEVMWEASRPPLTTVDMELEHLGRRAAERLLAAITAGADDGGGAEPGLELIPPRLVVRGSTIAGD